VFVSVFVIGQQHDLLLPGPAGMVGNNLVHNPAGLGQSGGGDASGGHINVPQFKACTMGGDAKKIIAGVGHQG